MKFPSRGGKPAAGQQWWDQVEEVPRAGLPDAKKMSKGGRKYRYAILASLFLLPISLLSNITMFSQIGETAPPAKVAVDKYAKTRAVAMVAVRGWLATTPAPLPGGELVDWKDATTRSWKPPADATNTSDTPYRIETHHLTVSTPEGISYTVTVPVGFDDAHGGVALATPSLVPDVPTDVSWQPSTYPDNEPFSAEESVTAAVAQWATAYTSGDPALLRQAIGDKDASRSYVPLSGARLRDVSVTESWVVTSKAPTVEGEEGAADQIIARVSAGIEWAVAPLDEADEVPVVVFDLLIDEAATAAPVVVAWGGAGSGLDLKPYINGTSDREILLDTPEEFEGEGEEGVDPNEGVDPSDTETETVDPNEGVENPDTTGTTGGKKGGKGAGKGGKKNQSTDDIVEGETNPDSGTEGATQ
jgi:hypothetical protein